jgi:hypothetical protein
MVVPLNALLWPQLVSRLQVSYAQSPVLAIWAKLVRLPHTVAFFVNEH